MSWQAFRDDQQHTTLEGLASIPLDVAYVDAGAGDPVVLLHGIPTWSFLWREVIPLLAAGRRVIAPDFLGHGFSDRRDRFDRSLVAQTAMVLALLDRLGIERADVAGHDTGGGVALILAIAHPERVRRVVLSNIVCFDSWPAAEMIELGDPRMAARPAGELVAWIRSGLVEGVHRPERRTAEFEEGILAPYADEEGKLSLIRNAVSLNTNHTMMLVDRHRDIAADVLLLWGADDPWQTIGDARRLAADIPCATLRPVDRASHWLQQDAPEVVAAQIAAFLED